MRGGIIMSKFSLKHLFLLLVMTTAVFAGDLRVDLVNGTTNTSGQAENVALIDLSTGMVPVASVSNISGSTTFSDLKAGAQSQYLVQAEYKGVSYSGMFVPNANEADWSISITVYETSAKVTDLHVSVPYFAIYASTDKLYIQKRLVLENHSNPPMTFSDSPGIVNVHVPDENIELESLTFKSGAMPLRTQTISTETGQVIPNAVKPGTSEIDMSYYMPYDGNRSSISEKVYYDIDHFHVYVMPPDLNISGSGLSREGTDTENGWGIYAIDQVKAGSTLDIQVSGVGISEAQAQQHSNAKIVVEHRISNGTKLGISTILILGILIALFISITQQSKDLKQESIDMLNEQKTILLTKYSKVEEGSKRETILNQLYSLYKTLDRIK
jgi:hypothetical protein